MKLKYIHAYGQLEAFQCLSDTNVRELEENIAPLISSIDDDELAKRFDYLMYTIEYADLKKIVASKPKNRVVTTAEKLTYKGTIDKVKAQEELIYKVQTDEYWNEADIFDHEEVRQALRDLIQYIINDGGGEIYYTNFTDEVLSNKENPGEYTVNNMQSYRKKVNKYLREHQNDMVIYKLRSNKPLTEEDIQYFEKILWQDLGTKQEYEKEYGNEPLLKLVSRTVGLDPQAANEVFSEFLSDENLNLNQMEFVKLIVNYVIKNGSIEKRILNEHPFNKQGNIMQLFDGKLEVAKRIVSVVDQINDRLSIS